MQIWIQTTATNVGPVAARARRHGVLVASVMAIFAITTFIYTYQLLNSVLFMTRLWINAGKL
jgi:hypothetical protein